VSKKKQKIFALISPAKLMDETLRDWNVKSSQPLFLVQAEQIMRVLKKTSANEVKKSMLLSDALLEQTLSRIRQWQPDYAMQEGTSALRLFKGEVYRGLNAATLTDDDLDFAQDHVGILSGLYGLLRSRDMILPYRLMMGTRLAIGKQSPNLYHFWSDHITKFLNDRFTKDDILIHLASDEYFKVIDIKNLHMNIVRCEFFQTKNGKQQMISTFAKHARGMMARYIIDHRVQSAEALHAFDSGGYRMDPKLSESSRLVFVR
jgi:uncharacterized protein